MHLSYSHRRKGVSRNAQRAEIYSAYEDMANVFSLSTEEDLCRKKRTIRLLWHTNKAPLFDDFGPDKKVNLTWMVVLEKWLLHDYAGNNRS